MDLEGTIEKEQVSSSVLVQARNLPGGPSNIKKSVGKFICTGAGPGPSRWTYRKSAGKFTFTDASQGPSRWT